MPDPVVERLGETQWRRFRAIRLRALEDAPLAFATTLAQAGEIPEHEWRRRVRTWTVLVAVDETEDVGLVCLTVDPDVAAQRHLLGMWVAPAARGSRAATLLVEVACARAAADGAEGVALWVVDGNDRARAFYARLGFGPSGVRGSLPDGRTEERLQRPSVGG